MSHESAPIHIIHAHYFCILFPMFTYVFLCFPISIQFPIVCGMTLYDFDDSTQYHACASCTPAKVSILVQESLSNLTFDLDDSAVIAQFEPNLLQLLILSYLIQIYVMTASRGLQQLGIPCQWLSVELYLFILPPPPTTSSIAQLCAATTLGLQRPKPHQIPAPAHLESSEGHGDDFTNSSCG